MIEIVKAISNFPVEHRGPFETAQPENHDFESEKTCSICLTRDQLEAIVQKIVAKATEPLFAEIKDLREEVAQLRDLREQDSQEIQDLKSKITEIETQQLQDVDRLALDIAQDRQRISKLEQKPVATPSGKKTTARIDRLKSILKSKRGTASFKDLRRELGLKSNQFSALIAKLDKRIFQVVINPRARDEKALRLRAFT